MYTVDEIKAFNDGTVFPETYEATYEATKHIQDVEFDIPHDIIENLKNELINSNFFIEDDSLLREIVVGLIKGNIILQGPPGTGKTTIASIICKVFNVESSIITAVSDWTTYDTIGGYQPSVNDDGDEIIIGKEGRIVESIIDCCNIILKHKVYGGDTEAKWLIIDELNRSEIDKVFGDLFTAFGSEELSKRKISLWFENDVNKKVIYIPQKYRMIGVMNNIDKNFVFDLSQGLSRRFSFITVNPPKIESFEEELKRIKEITKNKIISRFGTSSFGVINPDYVDKIYEDNSFIENEHKVKKFLKYVRYYENKEYYLGLSIGTAQIIDVYETILINLIVSKFVDLATQLEKKQLLATVIDSTINSKIVPQMDGFDYERLVVFSNSMNVDNDFSDFTKTKETLLRLI